MEKINTSSGGGENVRKTFTRYIITGLIALLPLWITLNILWLLFKLISGIFTPIINPILAIFLPDAESAFLSRLTSFFLTIGVVWIVGVIATNLAGRRILIKLENLLIRLPILKDIYVASRKLIVLIFTKKTAFRKVVLVEFPRKGMYSLGFITSETVGEVQEKTKEDVINVFIPTTPNPTTGFFLMVPKKDVINLNMSVDDAIKMIITGGLVTPESRVSAGNDENFVYGESYDENSKRSHSDENPDEKRPE